MSMVSWMYISSRRQWGIFLTSPRRRFNPSGCQLATYLGQEFNPVHSFLGGVIPPPYQRPSDDDLAGRTGGGRGEGQGLGGMVMYGAGLQYRTTGMGEYVGRFTP